MFIIVIRHRSQTQWLGTFSPSYSGLQEMHLSAAVQVELYNSDVVKNMPRNLSMHILAMGVPMFLAPSARNFPVSSSTALVLELFFEEWNGPSRSPFGLSGPLIKSKPVYSLPWRTHSVPRFVYKSLQ